MTVFIHYTGSPNFRVIITQIQPQLSPDDDIYVVDSSPNREGLRLAKLYGSTRCYIFVEVGNYSPAQAYLYAYENMTQNKQDGLLLLSENLVVSNTFIHNLKKATRFKDYAFISPKVLVLPYHQFPNNFKWYNPPPQKVIHDERVHDSCYFTRNLPGEKGGSFHEETVVLLPTNPETS